ncbi:GTP-binding protein [Paraburkholderia sp.]|jgi:G3E family GTPase|uniref:CobW family GTP-binding protein n=1 Tax=Paraburkholderia sp. TaxID=1926495 RepID=UPI002F424134
MRLNKIPATVVTGFLGAGKTTLVNHLLEHSPATRIGIVVNEFGEVGIDGQLIVAEQDAVVEINNGCVCCTVRKDLVNSVAELLARPGKPVERLIVETSGLADPAPVLQTFLADPDVRERVELESVLAVVDARHFHQQLNDEIAREQVVFADHIVINKTDLVTPDEVTALVACIRSLNPTATLDVARHGALGVEAVFGVRHFSLDALLSVEPDLLDEDGHEHEHDDSIASCSFVIPGPLDASRFNRWVNQLVQSHGQQLLRMKGVLNLHEERRRLHFHSVHMLLEASFGKAWAQDEARDSKFVMIGRDLDMPAMREGLLGCMA